MTGSTLKPVPGALAVAIASDDAFVAHLAALMLSVMASARSGGPLDLLVLDGGISPRNRNLLRRQFASQAGGQDRLSFLDCAALHTTAAHPAQPAASLYRLCLCSLLPEYGRVIYLDCDTIVLGNLWELWRVELDGAVVAAAPDLPIRLTSAGGQVPYGDHAGMGAVDYFEQVILPGGSIDEYFQSGVLVFDLGRCRELGLEETLLRDVHAAVYWYYDQDVLNRQLRGRVKFLDTAWNHLPCIEAALPELAGSPWADAIRAAAAAPKLIHYAGAKPWDNADAPRAEPYWRFARRTFWHGETLRRLREQAKGAPRERGPLYRALRGLWRCCPGRLRRRLEPLKNWCLRGSEGP